MTEDTRELFNKNAEAALLGAVLLEPEEVLGMADVEATEASDFWYTSHRNVWRAVRKLQEAGRAVDLVTVKDELQRAGHGDDFLEVPNVVTAATTWRNAPEHARIVRDWRRQRDAERALSELGAAFGSDGRFEGALDDTIQALNGLKSERGGPVEHRTLEEIRAYFGDVQWAWPGWIPVGHLTLIAGAQGEGKSYLAARLAASVTGCTEEWPDGLHFGELEGWAAERLPGRVLLVETEEMRGVYAERWERMGVKAPWVIFGPGDETHLPDLLGEAEEIERLAHEEAVEAIIVDSLSGGHGLKETGAEMRQLLKRYSAMAGRLNIPVIVVHHVRKKRELESTQVTLDRVRGSTTITQFCRSVIALHRLEDGDQTSPVRVESIKSTFCAPPEPFGFTVTDRGLVFGEAPEAIRPVTQQDKAADLLLTLLKSGPVASSKLYEEAEGAGISKRTLKIAKKNLGVVANRQGGASGHWEWALPARLGDEEIPV